MTLVTDMRNILQRFFWNIMAGVALWCFFLVIVIRSLLSDIK